MRAGIGYKWKGEVVQHGDIYYPVIYKARVVVYGAHTLRGIELPGVPPTRSLFSLETFIVSITMEGSYKGRYREVQIRSTYYYCMSFDTIGLYQYTKKVNNYCSIKVRTQFAILFNGTFGS